MATRRERQPLPFHPLADLFPLLEGAARDELQADIKEHGLIEPIVLLDDKILDGRNRYLACLDAGVEPTFRPFCGDDPVAFVVSLNLKRRHLDESQRAWVASKLASLPLGSNQHGSANLPTQDDAATLLNVSPRSLRNAKHVRDNAVAELQQAVEQGKIAVSLAANAAKLPPGQQREIAKRARAGDDRVVKKVVKQNLREKREQELGGKQCALPNKKYGVIYADAEWKFEAYSENGMDRSADNHYSTSALEVIKSRDVPSIAADDCVLFLWATVPILVQALEVMTAWGFSYRSNFAWVKPRAGTGYWNRNRHELLLVGTRGNVPAPAPGTQWESVIEAPTGRHSEKPEAAYELIEAYFPNLPKIELNSRRARAGWDSWGFEAPIAVDDLDIPLCLRRRAK